MIPQYRVLAQRIRTELQALDHVVERAEGALERATQQPQDEEYFLTSAALDLHGFYAGIERLLELIARHIDGGIPSGPAWHRDLLAQVSLSVPGVRPAVLAPETASALTDYLGFRHVVRSVYTFDLRPQRVAELTHGLRSAFIQAKRDLLTFVEFLEQLSETDAGA